MKLRIARAARTSGWILTVAAVLGLFGVTGFVPSDAEAFGPRSVMRRAASAARRAERDRQRMERDAALIEARERNARELEKARRQKPAEK